MMSIPDLTVKTQVEPPMQASKWLQLPILIDSQEMEALFEELGEFWIFQTSSVVVAGHGLLSSSIFLKTYENYIEALKAGRLPDPSGMRACFSAIFTNTPDALYALRISDTQQIIKVSRPVIQLQPHRFTYSPLDGQFRSMTLSADSVSWGIQFSYPQLYQDPALQVKKVKEGAEFPNTALFKRLQRWVRHHTIATPFEVGGQCFHVPIRLGKQCLSWINQHPQLAAKGLSVKI